MESYGRDLELMLFLQGVILDPLLFINECDCCAILVDGILL